MNTRKTLRLSAMLAILVIGAVALSPVARAASSGDDAPFWTGNPNAATFAKRQEDRLAKARAAMDGRAVPDLEDVNAMAVPVLSHRLILQPEYWLTRQVSDRLVKGVGFLMKKNNVDVHMGAARVTASDTVVLTDKDGKTTELKTKNIVMATGATVAVPPGWQVDGVGVFEQFDGVAVLRDAPHCDGQLHRPSSRSRLANTRVHASEAAPSSASSTACASSLTARRRTAC